MHSQSDTATRSVPLSNFLGNEHARCKGTLPRAVIYCYLSQAYPPGDPESPDPDIPHMVPAKFGGYGVSSTFPYAEHVNINLLCSLSDTEVLFEGRYILGDIQF